MVLFWRWLADDALAQAPLPPINPSVLEAYGPGGVVATIALAFMWAERQRANKAEDENRELNKVIRESIVPALTQATSANNEAMRFLRKDSS